MAILDTLFGIPQDNMIGGLLGNEQADKLRQQAVTSGLINSVIGYLAQPKNQRLGSAVPYIARGLMMGQQGAQGVYEDALKNYANRMQFAEATRKQQQILERQKLAKDLYQTIPAQTREVQIPGINVPVPVTEGAVAPNFATQYQPPQTMTETVSPERRVINPQVLTQLAATSDDPLAALSTTAKLIPDLRRAGMLEGAAQQANPFDVYVSGAASPNTRNLAMKYARDYQSGLIDDEKANTLLSQIAGMEDKFAARQDNNEFRQQLLEQNAGMKAQALELAKSSQALQRLTIEDRLIDRAAAREEKQVAKGKRLETISQKADVVMDTIDSALGKTSAFTTGTIGSVIGGIPGTRGYDLRKDIDTIKANIGFNELQAMREASPTGGALGQVAVQELNSLQSTLGSLDPNQSQDVLRKNLEKIYRHYSNWKDAVTKAQAVRNPEMGGGGWSIKEKK